MGNVGAMARLDLAIDLTLLQIQQIEANIDEDMAQQVSALNCAVTAPNFTGPKLGQ
jgi:hypothetical protein